MATNKITDGLADMKRTKQEIKAEAKEWSTGEDREYGYGLCIRLEEEDMAKLGMKTLPQVGDTFVIEAVGRVESSYQSQSVSNKDDQAFSLQITHLSLTKKMGGT
jgi:hypothetical protein